MLLENGLPSAEEAERRHKERRESADGAGGSGQVGPGQVLPQSPLLGNPRTRWNQSLGQR